MIRPARYPPQGSWPGVMRADMVAAFFDLDDVAALLRSIGRGEAPRPTDSRLRGRVREPLWALEGCRAFVARRHGLATDDGERLVDLV